MKATALLKKQHRTVERMLESLENGSADWASELNELANNLAAHMAIEQDLFYPAASDIDGGLIAQSYEQHATAELALKRLLATAGDDPTFAVKVVALKELIEQHVAEEEEELFPEVDEKMDDEELKTLGEEMSAAFDEAVAQGYKALLPEGLEASADAAQLSPSEAPPAGTIRRGSKRSGAPHNP